MNYNPNRTPAGSPDGGKFASGDATKNEAGQVDAFERPEPETMEQLQPGDRFVHQGHTFEVEAVSTGHGVTTVQTTIGEVINRDSTARVTTGAPGNEVTYDNNYGGDDSLSKEATVSHRWTLPDGKVAEANVTFYVTGRVDDSEDYNYEDAEFEGVTVPTDRDLSFDEYEQWRTARESIAARVTEEENAGRVMEANEMRYRLDSIPTVGFAVQSSTEYRLYSSVEDADNFEEPLDSNFEYNDHTMMSHWDVASAERQAYNLARTNNWNHYEPQRFFNSTSFTSPEDLRDNDDWEDERNGRSGTDLTSREMGT